MNTFQMITKIAKRAQAIGKKAGHDYDLLTLEMDITAAHADIPMDLKALMNADDSNFGHDVFGINRYIDRQTSKLTNCFVPRFALPEKSNAS